MTKSVNSSFSNNSAGDFQITRQIIYTDWRNIARDQHHVYGRAGYNGCGIVFSPRFRTSDNVYTTDDDDSNRNLVTFNPSVILPRRMENSGDKVALSCYVFGTLVDVQFEITTTDTNVVIATGTTTVSATDRWAIGTAYIDWADAHVGGSTSNDLRLMHVKFQAKRNTASDAEIEQIHLRNEVISSSSKIPSGLP